MFIKCLNNKNKHNFNLRKIFYSIKKTKTIRQHIILIRFSIFAINRNGEIKIIN